VKFAVMIFTTENTREDKDKREYNLEKSHRKGVV
jgi:hypothetical protein